MQPHLRPRKQWCYGLRALAAVTEQIEKFIRRQGHKAWLFHRAHESGYGLGAAVSVTAEQVKREKKTQDTQPNNGPGYS